MKPNTKIKILGWAMIVWGLAGLLRKVYIPIILLPLGIGLLFKKNIARIVTIYFCFFSICMSILWFIGFLFAVLIPRAFSKNVDSQSIDSKAIFLGIGMVIMFIVLGAISFYVYKLLKRGEIKAEFLINKIQK